MGVDKVGVDEMGINLELYYGSSGKCQQSLKIRQRPVVFGHLLKSRIFTQMLASSVHCHYKNMPIQIY